MCVCPVCSESDLKEAVGRLRDWFRVLHENGNHKRVKIQKPEKNSKTLFLLLIRFCSFVLILLYFP